MKSAHKFGVELSLNTYFRNFSPPLKIGWEKPPNFADCHQLEAHSFKAAQRIDNK